ncbi:MAG: hypothetical protein ABH852_05555 [Methanobacteriota archaeon]
MRHEKRGFFSIDALFALTLLLIVTASFMNIYEGRKRSAELIDDRLEAKIIGEKLAAAMNTTYVGGATFELRVNLPENVGKHSYLVTFDNVKLQISVENSAWGAVRIGVACKNAANFVLGPENLRNYIRVYWDGNQIMVVAT